MGLQQSELDKPNGYLQSYGILFLIYSTESTLHRDLSAGGMITAIKTTLMGT